MNISEDTATDLDFKRDKDQVAEALTKLTDNAGNVVAAITQAKKTIDDVRVSCEIIMDKSRRDAQAMNQTVSEMVAAANTATSQAALAVQDQGEKIAAAIIDIGSMCQNKKAFRMTVKRGLDGEIESADFVQV